MTPSARADTARTYHEKLTSLKHRHDKTILYLLRRAEYVIHLLFLKTIGTKYYHSTSTFFYFIYIYVLIQFDAVM